MRGCAGHLPDPLSRAFALYAYGHACAPDRLKIGLTEGDTVDRIAAQIGTGTPDKPVLSLEIVTHDCGSLEKAIIRARAELRYLARTSPPIPDALMQEAHRLIEADRDTVPPQGQTGHGRHMRVLTVVDRLWDRAGDTTPKYR
jgi:hypothetical protein